MSEEVSEEVDFYEGYEEEEGGDHVDSRMDVMRSFFKEQQDREREEGGITIEEEIGEDQALWDEWNSI